MLKIFDRDFENREMLFSKSDNVKGKSVISVDNTRSCLNTLGKSQPSDLPLSSAKLVHIGASLSH